METLPTAVLVGVAMAVHLPVGACVSITLLTLSLHDALPISTSLIVLPEITLTVYVFAGLPTLSNADSPLITYVLFDKYPAIDTPLSELRCVPLRVKLASVAF